MSEVPPIRREILVDADPGLAFRVFTVGIGRWWPLSELSVHGAGSTVSFAGGRIVERSAGGDEAVWGTVTSWLPGNAVGFTWHPGRGEARASHVTITFRAEGDGTLVTLEHTGWEVFDDPAAARDEYDHGWPPVLELYQAAAAEGETWVALMHRAGPAATPGVPIPEDPRFREHVAWLGRMREAGYLVAAGALVDTATDGMTILRLPGQDRLADATRLATEDDISVASGFFAVSVRPWAVQLEG